MLTVRNALVDHLQLTLPLGLGIQTVKPYSGEIEQLARNPAVLTAAMPMVLVIYVEGQLYRTHEMHLLVVTRTAALDQEGNAADGLGAGEQLAKWLDGHFTFRGQNGEGYNILNASTGGISVRTRKITTAYTITDISFAVSEG